MAYSQIFLETFEGGTNGATVTTGNTGATTIVIGAGNSFTFSNSSPLDGTLSGVAVQVGANKPSFRKDLGATGYTDIAIGMLWNIDSYASSAPLWNIRSTQDSSGTGIDLQFTSGGKILVRDEVAATNSGSSSGTLSAATDYWVGARYQSSTGNIVVDVYPKGSNTVAASITYAIAASLTVKSFETGVLQASVNKTLKMDYLAIGTGGNVPRPDVTNAAPVLTRNGGSANPAPILLGDSIVLPFGATDDSQVATIACTNTSRPSGATLLNPTGGSYTGQNSANATRSFTATPTAVGTWVYTGQATDDGALTSNTLTYTVEVAPTGTNPTIIRQESQGTWSPLGAVGTIAEGLLDNDNTTGGQTVASPTNAIYSVQFGPLPPGKGIAFDTEGARTTSGTITRVFTWYKANHSTTIGSPTTIVYTTSTPTASTVTMADAARAGITDLEACYLWLDVKDTWS